MLLSWEVQERKFLSLWERAVPLPTPGYNEEKGKMSFALKAKTSSCDIQHPQNAQLGFLEKSLI